MLSSKTFSGLFVCSDIFVKGLIFMLLLCSICNNGDYHYHHAYSIEWTQMTRAVSSIYVIKTEGHTKNQAYAVGRINPKIFCSMHEKWRNYNYGHWESNCWYGSKMAAQPEKDNRIWTCRIFTELPPKTRWTVVTDSEESNLSSKTDFWG